jgi:hypothetical protein
MTPLEAYTERVRKSARPSFVVFEDGFHYFWPDANCGAYAADSLRVIADYIDELNKPIEDHIAAYFAAEEKA